MYLNQCSLTSRETCYYCWDSVSLSKSFLQRLVKGAAVPSLIVSGEGVFTGTNDKRKKKKP